MAAGSGALDFRAGVGRVNGLVAGGALADEVPVADDEGAPDSIFARSAIACGVEWSEIDFLQKRSALSVSPES